MSYVDKFFLGFLSSYVVAELFGLWPAGVLWIAFCFYLDYRWRDDA